MARPRKDSPPDRFTSADMALAGGTTPRNFSLLVDRGLAPEAVSGGGGRGAARMWNSYGVSHIALVSALHGSCGLELLLAAKLAAAFEDDFSSVRGLFPSNLSDFLQRPYNPNFPHAPWQKEENEQDIRDDFWLHHYLRTRSKVYRRARYMRGDVFMEIVNRQFVFTALDPELRIKFVGGKDAEPLARIVGLDRGADAEVLSLADEVDLNHRDPKWQARFDEVEREFFSARENAIGVIRVNVSLAIRNAFDAIHDYRIESGASFNWQSTGQQPPTRRTGEDGWPTDDPP